MQNPLIGTWQLNSWTITNAAGDCISEPFGASPQGLIIYTDTGWMSAAISHNQRPLFPDHQSLRSQPPASLAQAYTTYFHYAGPYRIEGETVIHTVLMSLNPNFVGSEQHRQFVLQGDLLTLSGREIIKSQTRYHQLQWQRSADQSL